MINAFQYQIYISRDLEVKLCSVDLCICSLCGFTVFLQVLELYIINYFCSPWISIWKCGFWKLFRNLTVTISMTLSVKYIQPSRVSLKIFLAYLLHVNFCFLLNGDKPFLPWLPPFKDFAFSLLDTRNVEKMMALEAKCLLELPCLFFGNSVWINT